jgi:hypothetical protein
MEKEGRTPKKIDRWSKTEYDESQFRAKENSR